MADKTDAVMDLAKRRGFLWPAYDIYGGAAGFYDYGPLGAVMKQRFEALWRTIFVHREHTPMAEIFCPRVTPEAVLVASGHVGEFTDLLVSCLSCKAPLRADHLVAAAGFTGNAGALKAPDIDTELAARKPKCPNCAKAAGFTPTVRQNLMNETEIGPGSGRVGYLRPETAQGIFVDFPFLFRHFRDRLPFGVVQLGGSNRNEISPRQGMLRLREFNMMEAEVFYDPAAKTHPKFSEVAQRKAMFVSNSDEKPRESTFGEAVKTKMVANEALAYWLARTQEFLVAAGLDPTRMHFRQHLKDEMAHYALDCWDAEFQSERYGWVECVGIADRGNYDLTQHAKHSGSEAIDPWTGTPTRKLNPDFLRYVAPQVPALTFKAKAFVPSKKFFPTLKQEGKRSAWLLDEAGPYAKEAQARGLATKDWASRNDRYLLTEKELSRQPATAPMTIQHKGRDVTIPADCYEVVELEVTVQGTRAIPCVIEPSFGVDRIMYACWEHAYESGEKNGEPYTRLRLSPHVAPIQVAILPLTSKDGLPGKAAEIEWTLRGAGILTDVDESGSIGRRYARQDEVGTPFCITVDNETAKDGAVTVRDRDTTQQMRVQVEALVETLSKRLA